MKEKMNWKLKEVQADKRKRQPGVKETRTKKMSDKQGEKNIFKT